ncbi:oligosaccharide flippase family protein [Faecalimonas umbilicata]|nr:oligosaccharide flippase family protein [Faecalimonas umbilicata]
MNFRSKKLFQYVVPTVLASCSSFLYTIVDGIFVGQGVGTAGLGAVNLAMPYVMIITALGMLMTIGGITMTAIYLGEKNETAANNVFRHSLTASAVIGTLLMIFGMVFAPQIAGICGANGTFLQMTSEYIFY